VHSRALRLALAVALVAAGVWAGASTFVHQLRWGGFVVSPGLRDRVAIIQKAVKPDSCILYVERGDWWGAYWRSSLYPTTVIVLYSPISLAAELRRPRTPFGTRYLLFPDTESVDGVRMKVVATVPAGDGVPQALSLAEIEE
jgi:hypothetical protein